MTYPEPDAAVIAAAREKHNRATAAVESTQFEQANVIIALKTCTDEKSRLLDLIAAGEVVAQKKLDKVEAGIATNEASLDHLAEILSRQESAVRQTADEMTKAHGLAQRPRVIAAIRELHEAGQAAAAARRALHDAENRVAEAKHVLVTAFGAGFPAPLALRPQANTIWTGFQIPTATHTAALRAVWGELADEALAGMAEA